MFKTLRSRLIFSYAAVVGLFLLLGVAGTAVLARAYGERTTFDNLREKGALVFPLVQIELNNSTRPAAQPLLTRMKQGVQNAGVRVLVVNADTLIVEDDSSPLYHAAGRKFPITLTQNAGTQLATSKGLEGVFRFSDEKVLFDYVARDFKTSATGRAAGAARNYIIVVSQQQRGVKELAQTLIDFLGPAALIALLISLLAGYLLARSISRPLAKLSEGTAAIAQGDYSKRLPVVGQDELAVLTERFNEMAQEVGRAHQMERDFVANVSHDLKTPLTSIQGFSQAMVEGAITEEQGFKQAASIINSEANRMSRLVNELLSLSRLLNSLDTLHLAPSDIVVLLRQVTGAMQPQAIQAGVNLLFESGVESAPTLADNDRLKQAVGNLIDNAIKYSPAGSAVSVRLAQEPGRYRVTVADSGPGIPSEDLDRVMERFYQVDKSRQNGHGGSAGLGLAIAREIVRAHHGELQVANDPAGGTRVDVLLNAEVSAKLSSGVTGILKRLGPPAKQPEQDTGSAAQRRR